GSRHDRVGRAQPVYLQPDVGADRLVDDVAVAAADFLEGRVHGVDQGPQVAPDLFTVAGDGDGGGDHAAALVSEHQDQRHPEVGHPELHAGQRGGVDDVAGVADHEQVAQ